MSEPVPTIPYQPVEFRRKPFFVVLAALIVVFSAIAVFASVTSLLDVFNMDYGSGIRSAYFPAMVALPFFIPADLGLLAAAVAFIARSRFVVMLLSCYFTLTATGLILESAAELLVHHDRVDVPIKWIPIVLYRMGPLAEALVYVVIIALIHHPMVRRLILRTSGANVEPDAAIT